MRFCLFGIVQRLRVMAIADVGFGLILCGLNNTPLYYNGAIDQLLV